MHEINAIISTPGRSQLRSTLHAWLAMGTFEQLRYLYNKTIATSRITTVELNLTLYVASGQTQDVGNSLWHPCPRWPKPEAKEQVAEQDLQLQRQQNKSKNFSNGGSSYHARNTWRRQQMSIYSRVKMTAQSSNSIKDHPK
jgi:hypothetical protein